MRVKGIVALLAVAGSATAAIGQIAIDNGEHPHITVSASGTVSTPPDRATILFDMRGEGATADEAASALAAKRKAIAGGIGGFDRAASLTSGQVSVSEARARPCENEYQARQMLSQGDCAVRGYIARMDGRIELRTVDKAATLAGLIGRLGGSNVQINSFGLADDGDARRRATAEALTNARESAEAIAEGAHVRLGSVTSVTDGNYGSIMVSASQRMAPPPPPPPPPPAAAPPIQIDMKPRPVETSARVIVTYAILP